MFGHLDLLMISRNAQLEPAWKIDLSIEYAALPLLIMFSPYSAISLLTH